MADGVFNIAKGAVHQMALVSPNDFLVLLLQANEAEATLITRADVAAVLAEAGTTEATFTNYARKTGLTGTVNVDNVNDRVDVDLSDQTWTAAGNGTNNTLTKLVVAWDTSVSPLGGDADLKPLTHHDFAVTTDGSDVTAQFDAAGFFRAS